MLSRHAIARFLAHRAIGPGAALVFALTTQAAQDEDGQPALGKQLAFSPDKGNCIACHVMDDAENGGNLGPPLLYMSARYPDVDRLADVITDARKDNPGSVMPPYGPHRILDAGEIRAIAEYVHSL